VLQNSVGIAHVKLQYKWDKNKVKYDKRWKGKNDEKLYSKICAAIKRGISPCIF